MRVRRAQDGSRARSAAVSLDGTPAELEAGKGIVGVVIAGPATTSARPEVAALQALSDGGGPAGLVTLRAMPIVRRAPARPPHPLRLYLESKGVGIAEGARLIDVSERALLFSDSSWIAAIGSATTCSTSSAISISSRASTVSWRPT